MSQNNSPVLPGRIEVITGPMFSGKSEELIRRLKRAQIAKRHVSLFKPDLDLRYHRTAIASHSSQTLDAITVPNVEGLKAILFPADRRGRSHRRRRGAVFRWLPRPALARAGAHRQARHSRRTRHHLRRRALPPIPDLLAVSDEVVKLSAVCTQCGAPAVHTQRLGASQSLVLVGAAGLYEARCRACFRPYVDERGSEQLEMQGLGVSR